MTQGDEPAQAVTVYTTIAGEDAARDLASALLEERLIACANVFPVWSMFHWEGSVQSESELVMLLKSTEDQVPALMKRVPELHPYEVPCVEVFRAMEVHPAFHQWLAKEADGDAAKNEAPPRH